jgi:hypothetical protein
MQVCEMESPQAGASTLALGPTPSTDSRGSEVIEAPFFIPEVSAVAHSTAHPDDAIHAGSVFRILGVPPAHDSRFQQERGSHILSWADAQQVSPRQSGAV